MKTKLSERRSSNRRNLKTPTSRFNVDGKHFENEAFIFVNDDVTIFMGFPCHSFPQTEIQIQNDR